MAEQEQPKIIVDTDWKSQAQAEKERLAAAEEARKAPAQGEPGGEGQPAPTFEELIRMLATQALLYLGTFPDPETGRRLVALELAQFNIELLVMLEEKTRGNLEEAEQKFLSQIIHDLRMQFVEIAKAVAKAVEQGKMPATGQGAAGQGMGQGIAGITGPGMPGPGGPATNIPPR